MRTLYQSVIATLFLGLLLCGIYPAAVTLVGKIIFPQQSRGNLITLPDGKVVGSKWIGQSFTKPEYFHGRPSAAGEKGYDALASGGSNLGPTNQKLVDGWVKNMDQVLQENPSLQKGQVPVDMVTASASGLDPHISPEAAFAQLDRIIKARHADKAQVESLVKEHIEKPTFGILGESVVNVLLLNLDLDRRFPVKG